MPLMVCRGMGSILLLEVMHAWFGIIILTNSVSFMEELYSSVIDRFIVSRLHSRHIHHNLNTFVSVYREYNYDTNEIYLMKLYLKIQWFSQCNMFMQHV